MSDRAEIILLCEDKQQQTFARLFLERMGWPGRKIRRLEVTQGEGSGAGDVVQRFPTELAAQRRRHVHACLVVMIDGDTDGVVQRERLLHRSCTDAGVRPPGATDNVVLCVPTRNIETWMKYLGGDEVDESSDYKGEFRGQRPRECAPQVRQLAQMCNQHRLCEPAPASLLEACKQYRTAALQPPRR